MTILVTKGGIVIKKIYLIALLLIISSLPVSAFVVNGAIYTTTLTKYLWRGIAINDGPAIQSGLILGADGITLQLWTSCQQKISPDLFDEIDLYANYEHSIPYADFLTVSIGYASYMEAPFHYPNIIPLQEINLTLKSDIISSPYLTWYHSIDAFTINNFLEGGVSYEYEIGKLSGGETIIGIAGTLGYNLTLNNVLPKGKYSIGFTVAGLNFYSNYYISSFTITPSVLFQLGLNNEKNIDGSKIYKNYATASILVNYSFNIGTETIQ